MLKKGLTTLVLGAALALSPVSAFAADHDGRGGGHGGGGGFSHSSRGFSGSGGKHFRGGHEGHFDRDDHYRGGRYYYGGTGFSFGFYGAPYTGNGPGYAYGSGSCGYYDQWGNWIPTPGCSVGPYGY